MKHKVITSRLTWHALWMYWMYWAYAILVLTFVARVATRTESVITEYAILGSMLIYILYLCYRMLGGISVKRRQKRFDAYLAEYLARDKDAHMATSVAAFAASSLQDLGKPMGKDVRNRRFVNVVEGQGWTYGDYVYDIYAHNKQGSYPVSVNYYSVLAMKLPRRVPHVLFDSYNSRGRQFRTMFAADQMHNLEGDINKFFAVYIPPGYSIDAYSFLSPEVLWAIREAADYDVEIKDDMLYLMGPMGEPDFVVQDMHDKAYAIWQKLEDNLRIYRDERLPYAQGRKGVSMLGMRLQESNTGLIVGFLMSIAVLSLYAVPYMHSGAQLAVVETIILLVPAGALAYKLRKKMREERRLKEMNYKLTARPLFRRVLPLSERRRRL